MPNPGEHRRARGRPGCSWASQRKGPERRFLAGLPHSTLMILLLNKALCTQPGTAASGYGEPFRCGSSSFPASPDADHRGSEARTARRKKQGRRRSMVLAGTRHTHRAKNRGMRWAAEATLGPGSGCPRPGARPGPPPGPARSRPRPRFAVTPPGQLSYRQLSGSPESAGGVAARNRGFDGSLRLRAGAAAPVLRSGLG